MDRSQKILPTHTKFTSQGGERLCIGSMGAAFPSVTLRWVKPNHLCKLLHAQNSPSSPHFARRSGTKPGVPTRIQSSRRYRKIPIMPSLFRRPPPAATRGDKQFHLRLQAHQPGLGRRHNRSGDRFSGIGIISKELVKAFVKQKLLVGRIDHANRNLIQFI